MLLFVLLHGRVTGSKEHEEAWQQVGEGRWRETELECVCVCSKKKDYMSKHDYKLRISQEDD